jgi:hypothetical protein
MYSGHVARIVETAMGNSVAKRRDNRRLRARAFNVCQKAPIAKFVIGFDFPFSIVVICSIVNDSWELGSMCSFVIEHDRGKLDAGFDVWCWFCSMITLDRARNLSMKVIWRDTGVIQGAIY